jgi:uncharacterized membrane protein
MKAIAPSVFVGLVIALGIIYWLRPLNAGAVALVVILCLGLAALIGRLLSGGSKPDSNGKS